MGGFALIVAAGITKYNTDPAAKAAADEAISAVVNFIGSVGESGAGTALESMFNESSEGTQDSESTPSGECQSCGGETTDSVGKISSETGISSKGVKEKIHGVKEGIRGSASKKNSDVEVCTDCGETYPKTDDGQLGDSIGKILDD